MSPYPAERVETKQGVLSILSALLQEIENSLGIGLLSKVYFSRLAWPVCILPKLSRLSYVIEGNQFSCTPTGHTSHHHSHHKMGLERERSPRCLGRSILLPAENPQISHEIVLVNS